MRTATALIGEYVDSGNAPEFFANTIREVDWMGETVARLIFVTQRRTPGGVLYIEPSLMVVVPTIQLGPIARLLTKRPAPTMEATLSEIGSEEESVH